MTRKIGKTLEEIAQYQFEDSLTISMLKNKIADDAIDHKRIKEDLDKVKDTVHEILALLKNDDSTNTKGIVQQTRDNNTRITHLEQHRHERQVTKKTLIAVVTIISGVVGWLTTVLFNQ